MALTSSESDVDVESLFGDVAPEPELPVHSAVTLRPEPARTTAVGPSPLRVVPSLSVDPKIMTREEPAAPVVTVSAPSAPSVPPLLASPVASLAAASGVLGYVVRDADGVLTQHGADARFADRADYISRLASLVGDELGLEGLREIHAVGEHRRIAIVLARDGSSVAAVAAADAELDEIGGWKR